MKIQLVDLEEMFNNSTGINSKMSGAERFTVWEYVAQQLEQTAIQIRGQQSMLLKNLILEKSK
jgi:hypothetical protein